MPAEELREHHAASRGTVLPVILLALPVLAVQAARIGASSATYPYHDWLVVDGLIACAFATIVLLSRAPRATADRPHAPTPWIACGCIAVLAWVAVSGRPAELFGGLPTARQLGMTLGALSVLAWWYAADKPLARRRSALLLLGIPLLALLVAWLLIGADCSAGWGLIDDHEVIRWCAGHARVTVQQAWAVLSDTEVCRWGTSLRYRPAYYVLRECEAMLWGDHPSLWYLARLGMFAASIALSWFALARLTTFPRAACFLAYVLTYACWGDIWCRLGPAETYAVLALSLWAWGAAVVLRPAAHDGSARRALAWVLIAVGAVVAVGCKENFLVLVPATGLVAILHARRDRLPMVGWLAVLVTVLWGAFIAIGVLLAVRRAGVDIYQHPIAMPQTRSVLLRGCAAGAAAFLPVWLLGVPVLGLACTLRLPGAPVLPRLRDALLPVSLCYLLWISQYVFYSGRWPTGMRYDFPGVLAVPGAVLVLAHAGLSWWAAAENQPLLRWAKVGLFTALAFACLWSGYLRLPAAADANLRRTQEFAARRAQIRPRLAGDPTRPLLLVSHQPRDIEPIVAVLRFLRADGVTNPIAIQLEGYGPATAASPLDHALTLQLADWSVHGSAGSRLGLLRDQAELEFQPLARCQAAASPFTLGFSGDAHHDGHGLGRIW